MTVQLDLHTHSHFSPDGRMRPEEILALAKAAGLQGAAICDHERVFTESCAHPELLLIPGVEFATEHGHLLGLFVSRPIPAGDFCALADAIHAQGGLTVLAHPFQKKRDVAKLLPVLEKLDGIEVFNSRAERKIPAANDLAREFALQHDLLFFAGSDAHVPEELGRSFVKLDCESLEPQAVKAALLSKKGQIYGRRSPNRHAARSQLTKLRKRKAGPTAYLKWAAFAVKCCLEDLTRGRSTTHVFDR